MTSMTNLPNYGKSGQEFTRCLICDHLIKFNISNNGNFEKVEKNWEMCQRFCTLACRFLDFTCNGNIDSNKSGNKNTDQFKIKETINAKNATWRTNLAQQLCDGCSHKAESFCEFYHNWTKLQLQLNHSVKEFSELIKISGQSEQKGMKKEFREKFLKRVDRMVMNDKVYPELKLTRLSFIQDGDDNVFIPVVMRKVRMSKSTTIHDTTEFHQNDTENTVPLTSVNDMRDVETDNFAVTTTFQSLAEKIIKPTGRRHLNVQNENSVQDIGPAELKQQQENEELDEQKKMPKLPFKCRFCKKRFSTLQNCRIHQSRMHKLNNLKRGILHKCGKAFKRFGNLHRHIAWFHNIGKEGARMLMAEWREIKRIYATKKPMKIKRITRANKLGKWKKNQKSKAFTENEGKFKTPTATFKSHYGMRERKLKPNYVAIYNDQESELITEIENDLNQGTDNHSRDDNLPFKCRFCDRRFSALRFCKIHSSRMHKNIRPKKRISTQQPKIAKNCNNETQSSMKTKPFACTLCGKAFAFRLALKIHKRNHIKVQNGQNEIFTDNGETVESQPKKPDSSSSSHFKNDEPKPFACRFCEKRFKFKHNCQVHLRVHTNERPFNCDMCGKKWKQKCHLQTHLSFFHGLLDAEVKRLLSKESERIAIKTKHLLKTSSIITTKGTETLSSSATDNNGKSENPYKCRFCYRRFRTMHSCKIHHGRVHKKSGLKNLKGFSKPINKNSPKSSVQILDNDDNVSNNEAGPGKRPSEILIDEAKDNLRFKCRTCDKGFSTWKNCNIHQAMKHKADFKLKTRSHKCYLCGSTWIRSDHLQRHIVKSHHFGEAAAKFLRSKWSKKNVTNKQNRIFNTQKTRKEAESQNSATSSTSINHEMGQQTEKSNNDDDSDTSDRCNDEVAQYHEKNEPQVGTLTAAPLLQQNKYKSKTGTKTNQNPDHDKPFACRFCPNRFKRKHNCQTHERTHTGESPFRCEMCGRRWKSYAPLKSHLSIFHGLLDVEVKRFIAKDSERRTSEARNRPITKKNHSILGSHPHTPHQADQPETNNTTDHQEFQSRNLCTSFVNTHG